MAIFRKTFTALAAGLALACMATAPALAQTVTQPMLEKIKARSLSDFPTFRPETPSETIGSEPPRPRR